MKSPGATKYFDGTWVARGKDVAELVNYMREQGLQFAAATPGDDAAYRALYNALAAYYDGLTIVPDPKQIPVGLHQRGLFRMGGQPILNPPSIVRG